MFDDDDFMKMGLIFVDGDDEGMKLRFVWGGFFFGIGYGKYSLFVLFFRRRVEVDVDVEVEDINLKFVVRRRRRRMWFV